MWCDSGDQAQQTIHKTACKFWTNLINHLINSLPQTECQMTEDRQLMLDKTILTLVLNNLNCES